MEKRDYKAIRDDFEKALSRHDIASLIKFQKELIESGAHSKGDWYRLAFFCGRQSMGAELSLFMKANEFRLRSDFSRSMFGFKYSDDFEDINTFYKVGARYPFLSDEDYVFLESYYTKSGTYKMIDEMLFDKELLQKDLQHYEAKKNR